MQGLDMDALVVLDISALFNGTGHVPHFDLRRAFGIFPVAIMVLAIGDMSGDDLLNVLPPLVQSGRFGEFIDAGRTLSMSLSPLDNSVATFVTAEVPCVTPGLSISV
jgi:hypothetical protein